jgi:5-methyltetrahydropteroyltriglutamate--homocysteine methyltransferase
VPSDGEFGKSISWSQYALERLSGFERRSIRVEEHGFNRGAERARFAEFYRELDAAEGPPAAVGASAGVAVCVGPISYTGHAELRRDIDNFKSGLGQAGARHGFLPVASPTSVIPDRRNEYYKSDEELLHAIADAMRVEYRAIIDAGLELQLDDARLAVTYDRMVPPASFADYRNWVALNVEAINHALAGIPEERVRYHVCWGSWPGPHVTDVPLKGIVDLVLKVRAGTYLIEGANPRHEHEWRVWEAVKLPEGKVLAPGMISHATNVVEHPELVAQRIVRLAKVVGRDRVMASTDCGFAQGPFHRRVHPTIMWAKLEALAEGARLASRELF